MPEYLAPGVYIEETSFRAKSIEGVSTTTTGFVGPTRYGPIDLEPDVITSFTEFERVYGDGQLLDWDGDGRGEFHNYVAHAVRTFFEQGGKRLYVSRAFTRKSDTDTGVAKRILPEGAADADAMGLYARFPGAAGNMRVRLSLRFGQNVVDGKGIQENDVVFVGKMVDAPPPAAPQLPTALPADADPAATTLLTQLQALIGNAMPPDPARVSQARRFAARMIDAAGSESAVLTANAASLSQQAARANQAAVLKAAEAAQLKIAADAAQDAADEAQADYLFAKATADAMPDTTPDEKAQKTAADAIAAAAKTRADSAQSAATAAKTAAAAAQTAADSLKKVFEDPNTHAGLKKDAADAQQAAAAAAKRLNELKTAELIAIPPPPPTPLVGEGKVGKGRLYIAKYDTANKRFGFDDGAGAEPIGSGANEIDADTAAIATLTLTFNPDSESPLFYQGLALDPLHTRNGARDSFDALFAPNTPNMALARSAPLQVRRGANVVTGVEVVQALFGNVDAIKTNTDLFLVPYNVDVDLTGGNDGQRPDLAAYTGKLVNNVKTGLMAFEDIEDISIIAAPGVTHGYDNGFQSTAFSVMQLLLTHAQQMRYRIAVLDSGNGESIAQVRALRGKMDSTYGALYYPWVKVLDPITREEIVLPPSGFVTGIYARNDINRAVWKAPANEVVNGAIGFETLLNKAQQDVLNPEGVNCFRYFEGRGFRLWGARTISSDPEWKYVNLRRYFCYLERSIDRGTQWAVFEPNGEALWANVRRTIDDFLYNEWNMGALLGDKPDKAYFVKCDRSTMTQNDLDNGRLVCLIGVAPLRPAEFVIFRIGQWTGDRKI